MIWNTKTADLGTTKTVTRFAWFPVELSKPMHHKVWLQRYICTLRYSEHLYRRNVFYWNVEESFVPDHFAQKSKRMDYYWPKTALFITSVMGVTNILAGFVTTPKPGSEWFLPAVGVAWLIALLWTVFAIAYNAATTRS